MTDHILAAERLHFAWDNSLEPSCALRGDIVTFQTWDASIHEIQSTWTHESVRGASYRPPHRP